MVRRDPSGANGGEDPAQQADAEALLRHLLAEAAPRALLRAAVPARLSVPAAPIVEAAEELADRALLTARQSLLQAEQEAEAWRGRALGQ